MDGTTQIAVVVLGLIGAGVLWWVLADVLKERRRVRAEVWALKQVSPDAKAPTYPAEDDHPTLVLAAWQLEEPPELVRPYMRARGNTKSVPSPHRPGKRTS